MDIAVVSLSEWSACCADRMGRTLPVHRGVRLLSAVILDESAAGLQVAGLEFRCPVLSVPDMGTHGAGQ
ncbi:hypothetical protein GCM10010521_74520 [Streptomyces rameus]|uniref:Uncharacterized protein n=1 Tax=Streptomyces rameus TaxID=68261 RepID=A0ABN3V9S5_9ACTN